MRAQSQVRRQRRRALGGLVAALALHAAPGHAGDGLPAGFQPIHPAEVVLGTAGLLSAGLASYVLPEPAHRWDGRNGFDESVRDELRAPQQGTRDWMAAASDGFFYGVVVYPVIVDAALVTWLGRGDGATAAQLALLDLAAYGESGLVATLGEYSGRARPYVRSCDRPGADEECYASGRHRGFLSGHTFAAFTGAGLMCVQHQFLPLYGSAVADALACAGGVTLASANAVLRVTSDMHYASDVLLASAGGFAVGYVLPALVHFGAGAEEAVRVTPAVDATHAGFVVRGVF